jgi:hypothetical protein
VIGHGIEADGKFYCCANCARQSGITGARDRVGRSSRRSRSRRRA